MKIVILIRFAREKEEDDKEQGLEKICAIDIVVPEEMNDDRILLLKRSNK